MQFENVNYLQCDNIQLSLRCDEISVPPRGSTSVLAIASHTLPFFVHSVSFSVAEHGHECDPPHPNILDFDRSSILNMPRAT